MYLIIGLGNLGKKYKKTRHNIGFIIIDELIKNYKSEIKNYKKKFNSSIWEVDFNNQKLILAKPLAFMNNSGRPIKSIIYNLKSNIQNLIVIHDDIDLPFGKIRVSKNSSSAGHKGVQSIIDELKTKNFTRIRIGIQPKTGKPKNTEKFVLEKFTKQEREQLKKIKKEAVLKIKQLL